MLMQFANSDIRDINSTNELRTERSGARVTVSFMRWAEGVPHQPRYM